MASDEPWFAARPGAQRQGKVIKFPLMYVGCESLTDVEGRRDGQAHVVGVSSEGRSGLRLDRSTGGLVSGDKIWVMIW